jgi:hypothetical protein
MQQSDQCSDESKTATSLLEGGSGLLHQLDSPEVVDFAGIRVFPNHESGYFLPPTVGLVGWRNGGCPVGPVGEAGVCIQE